MLRWAGLKGRTTRSRFCHRLWALRCRVLDASRQGAGSFAAGCWERVKKSIVVQAFRHAAMGGPEGPHYTEPILSQALGASLQGAGRFAAGCWKLRGRVLGAGEEIDRSAGLQGWGVGRAGRAALHGADFFTGSGRFVAGCWTLRGRVLEASRQGAGSG